MILLHYLIIDELISQQNFITEFESHIFKPDQSYDGDLTNSKNIDAYIQKNINNKSHLITADGGLDKTTDTDFKLEELYHFPLFLGESITAILNQKKVAHLFLKFNIIDINSINLLYLLSAFYKTVLIKKPYTSRPHNSENTLFVLILLVYLKNNIILSKIVYLLFLIMLNHYQVKVKILYLFIHYKIF